MLTTNNRRALESFLREAQRQMSYYAGKDPEVARHWQLLADTVYAAMKPGKGMTVTHHDIPAKS